MLGSLYLGQYFIQIALLTSSHWPELIVLTDTNSDNVIYARVVTTSIVAPEETSN